jgi:ATP-dependent Clp protease ATP-binding subunit ClpA
VLIINRRFLPDKAIDLVDEAAAKLKMEITSKPVVRVRCAAAQLLQRCPLLLLA